jgi:hypothetical protein
MEVGQIERFLPFLVGYWLGTNGRQGLSPPDTTLIHECNGIPILTMY